MRTLKVQVTFVSFFSLFLHTSKVERRFWVFRHSNQLLGVLNKAKDTNPAVLAAVERYLQEWIEQREQLPRLASASASDVISDLSLSSEAAAYVSSIAPTWDSLLHRDSLDLSLILQHLCKIHIIDEPFVQGELKRYDFAASETRKKVRQEPATKKLKN